MRCGLGHRDGHGPQGGGDRISCAPHSPVSIRLPVGNSPVLECDAPQIAMLRAIPELDVPGEDTQSFIGVGGHTISFWTVVKVGLALQFTSNCVVINL